LLRNRVDPQLETVVVEVAVESPACGQIRISSEVLKGGCAVVLSRYRAALELAFFDTSRARSTRQCPHCQGYIGIADRVPVEPRSVALKPIGQACPNRSSRYEFSVDRHLVQTARRSARA
jgi:hypothetical protein